MSKARIAVNYCTKCNWLLRAAWMAQELLATFPDDLAEVALVPGEGGVFKIVCDKVPIWDRVTNGGFPDAATLKRLVRDHLDPDRDLGHVETTRRSGETGPGDG